MPLLKLAPAGSPTVGTLDVQDMKVGSEILSLSMGRFWRPEWPAARWGRGWVCCGREAVDVAGESPFISNRGGVALAEKGGAAGEGRGAPIMGEGTGNGRSLGVPARLS